jgi:short subunit dehydrogenase-like uncharacterized protein
MDWMIYGAAGYTGELIAREAKARGLSPVLAGRSAEKLAPLARELGLPQRIFELTTPSEIAPHLDGIGLLLHCAGPFAATSRPMLGACLQTKTHYLDITGEVSVFEHAHAKAEAAERAGIVVCPGVGFDVIPTDCVALALKNALPDATHLSLGFDTRPHLSPGTAKTTVEGIVLGGKIRENGTIRDVPLAYRVRRIDFGAGEKLAMTVPWGDVSTAWQTTGIPNIDVYIPGSARFIAATKRANYLRWFMGLGPVQALLKRRAGKMKGPTADERAKMPTYVWGEATNAKGEKKTARIRTENGYSVTVTGSLAVVEFLLRERPPGGSYTPARLLGADLVTKLPGSGPLVVA